MNKLLSKQRTDGGQVPRNLIYSTLDFGSRTSQLPLRNPKAQRSDSQGGLTGSKSINQIYGSNSMVASSSINTGSGTVSKTKTFCYQPVIRNNMQRVSHHHQSS